MRVIVCGSRNWEGVHAEWYIQSVLTEVALLGRFLQSPLTVIHGGCATGADAIAHRWAVRRDLEPEVHWANWLTYRKAAGPKRNTAMAEAGADMCLAFLRDESRGTRDMIDKARAYRIPTFVVRWEEISES